MYIMFEGTGYWNGMENIVFDSDYIIAVQPVSALTFCVLLVVPGPGLGVVVCRVRIVVTSVRIRLTAFSI